jgi:enediyne biosynthesis protein E4
MQSKVISERLAKAKVRLDKKSSLSNPATYLQSQAIAPSLPLGEGRGGSPHQIGQHRESAPHSTTNQYQANAHPLPLGEGRGGAPLSIGQHREAAPHSSINQSPTIALSLPIGEGWGGAFLLLLFFFACGKSDPTVKTPTLFALKCTDDTGIRFANQVPDQAPNGLNIIQYLYYYNGGGVATTDLNGDQLPDIYFTSNLGPDALYINRGGFKFDTVPLPYPLNPATKWSTGVTYTDINCDGRTDIYVCQVGNYKGAQGRNLLYINEGNDAQGIPRFSEQAEKYGLALSAFCTQAAFFDYDRDGDLDCYILCHSVHSAGVYRDTAQTRKWDALAADRLYINDGKGHFTEVGQKMGLYGGIASYGLGLSISDFTGDNWPEIYVGNDFHESDYLYLNPGTRKLNSPIASANAIGHTSNFTMGTDAADINNDGRIDLLTLDMLPPDEYTRKASQPVDQLDIFEYKHKMGYDYQYPRNALQVNLGTDANGEPVFAEIAQYAGVEASDWSWSPLLADFDLDGLKDIFITNGIKRRGNNLDFLKFSAATDVQTKATDVQIAQQMPEGLVPNVAFRNAGNCRFSDVSAEWGLNSNTFSNGSAYADFDLDGDLDLVVNHLNATAEVFENTSKQANRILISLKGSASNSLAIGARVEVIQGALSQTFEVMPTRGFQSASDVKISCALTGKDTPNIRVSWPNGTYSEQQPRGISDNIKVQIDQADAQMQRPWSEPETQRMARRENLPKAQLKQPEYTRPEVTEKLVPWRSMLQNGKVKGNEKYTFTLGNQPQVVDLKTLATQKVQCEGEINCAAFCDIDGDGQQEILVGVRNIPAGSGLAILRQNKGVWQEDPNFYHRTDEIAVIAPADIDADGDQDLFLGCGHSDIAYGQSPRSHLLINNGKGVFTALDASALDGLDYTGMVRDAFWADMNRDKKLDLVVAGEWMPIKIFYQLEGRFRESVIPNTDGFWQCLTASDVNNDGLTDILAGNFGENTRLRVSDLAPARLLIGDRDGNGQNDPIVGYFHRGVQYVLPDRDLLASQMPMIKRKFPQYDAYAKAGFDQVFPPSANATSQQTLTATNSSSLAILNTGSQADWRVERLPEQLQWSSVHVIKPYKNGYLVGGNMFDVQPYLGRQDAAPIWLMQRMGENNWRIEVFDLIRGEVRDLSNY